MDLAVVAPLEDPRGDGVEHLRSWTHGQSLARDRYQVVIGANGEHPDFERRVAGLLAPHDLLVRAPGASLMGLWDAAARASRAPWLLFTEAHCIAEPDCLAVLVGALAEERGFTAANLEQRQAPHTRVGALTERWFEAVGAEWARAGWTRLNLAGVAIHRDAYARAGGLQPRYGLFSSPLLAARLHESGGTVAQVPGAVISHRLEENMGDGIALSADWARGECAVRADHDQVFCQRYFGPEGLLARHDSYDPEIARTLLSALVPAAASSWRDARWLARETAMRVPAAISGARVRLTAERLACACHARVADAPLPMAVRWRSYVAAHESAVRTEQLRWIVDVGGPSTSALSAGSVVSAADFDGALVGMHALEYDGERPFRWTEPVALLRVALPDRHCVLRVDTGGVRGSPLDHIRSLRVGARSLPRALMRASGDVLEVSLPRAWAQRATRRGVTVLCRPLVPRRHGSADPRRLGLPIFSVETIAA
jgi:hypothetical protein